MLLNLLVILCCSAVISATVLFVANVLGIESLPSWGIMTTALVFLGIFASLASYMWGRSKRN